MQRGNLQVPTNDRCSRKSYLRSVRAHSRRNPSRNALFPMPRRNRVRRVLCRTAYCPSPYTYSINYLSIIFCEGKSTLTNIICIFARFCQVEFVGFLGGRCLRRERNRDIVCAYRALFYDTSSVTRQGSCHLPPLGKACRKSSLFLLKCNFCKSLWQSNKKSVIYLQIPINPSVRRVRRVYTL